MANACPVVEGLLRRPYVYWIMKSLGQENVRVMDGTVKDWASAGKPIANETTIMPPRPIPHSSRLI